MNENNFNIPLAIVIAGILVAGAIIYVGFGGEATQRRMGDKIDLVYSVGVNEWNGRREWQLKILDMRTALPS